MKKLITYLSTLLLSVNAFAASITQINSNNGVQHSDVFTLIYGSNTQFLAGIGAGVWISQGNIIIPATSYSVIDDTTLQANFYIPPGAGIGQWDVYANTVANGTLKLSGGFTVNPSPTAPWLWAKSIAGHSPTPVTSACLGNSIVTDYKNNSYVTGRFSGTVVIGGWILTSNNYPNGNPTSDAYIVKYDSNGKVLWATSIPTTGSSQGWGIALDPKQGSVYVTGTFDGKGKFGGMLIDSGFNADVFIAKYSVNGSLQWIKQTGQLSSLGFQASISVDKYNNCYVTGGCASAGSWDIFITKYDQLGNFNWIKKIGGPEEDRGYSISVVPLGSSFLVSGIFSGSVNFDGVPLQSHTDSNAFPIPDLFVASFNLNGQLQWVKTAISDTGLYANQANSLYVDNLGNCYLTGAFAGKTDFGNGFVLQNTPGPNGWDNFDAFIAKYNPNGDVVLVKQFQGSENEQGTGVAVDQDGRILLTGCFGATNGGNNPSISFDGNTLIGDNERNVYIFVLDKHGTYIKSAKGTSFWSNVGGISQSSENLYITGYFSNYMNFNNLHFDKGGSPDAFVAKYNYSLPVINPVMLNSRQ